MWNTDLTAAPLRTSLLIRTRRPFAGNFDMVSVFVGQFNTDTHGFYVVDDIGDIFTRDMSNIHAWMAIPEFEQ